MAVRNIERATSRGGHWKRTKRRKNRNPEKQVPIQIRLLGSNDPDWQKGAHSLLVKVTFQDLGYNPRAWQTWYKRNMHRSRADWAADALERAGIRVLGLSLGRFIPKLIAALRHSERRIRSAAYHLLLSYTGRSVYFPLRGGAELREKHVRQWIKWWKRKGVRIFRPTGNNGNGRKGANGRNGY